MATEKKTKKNDGRTTDLTFGWLTKVHGECWEEWKKLAAEWLTEQESGVHTKISGLTLFFDSYLANAVPWASSICVFFEGANGHVCSSKEFREVVLRTTNRSDNKGLIASINQACTFLDWVLDTHFSEPNDNGHFQRLWNNPMTKEKVKVKTAETIYNPLPYRYICDLRHILCPNSRGHFSDWIWAQENAAEGNKGGDWFEVDLSLIDKTDPDCVWRAKEITRRIKGNPDRKITIHKIWSPARAMVLFIKLHLPLRTYQVRMLDSGEADTMRYVDGKWVDNDKHSFAMRHFAKGVFRRFVDNATGISSSGLYISTNKTADQNKDEMERGYEIPWQNEDVLYWLEKLRNWQEKYNPISQPTDCITLLPKHTCKMKSKSYLTSMGHVCFLFRDASAKSSQDRTKPIQDSTLSGFWYKLLNQLEENLKVVGDTLSDGTNLSLVHDYGDDHKIIKKKTKFPLHSLRVSLITCYAMETKVPLPVISKLLAGHSRLLMTIYYTKLTPAVMKEKMDEAQQMLEDNSEGSLRTFLKDAKMRQILLKVAYHDGDAIEAALVNRNPIGWECRQHGLCLVGGNTVRSDETMTVAGCWNGGELIRASGAAHSRLYGPVPHGAENCVRCRWFITNARYLPALNAHLNFMSYKASEAANLAVSIEGDIESMEEQKYDREAVGRPFTRHNELQALQRRHEKQLVEADEFTKDWIATFHLIQRVIEIERDRSDDDTTNKLVAVGNQNDLKIGFMETESELLQLSLICDDAEFYPSLLDEVKKTPAIEVRTQTLSRIMMKKGYMPYLLMMDKEHQLIAANAMMRQMASIADPENKLEGYCKVADYFALEQFFEDEGLLDIGIKALTVNGEQPVLRLTDGNLNIMNEKGGVSNAV